MLSDKPMRIRLAFSGACFAAVFGILYLEEWIAVWFPKLPNTAIFLMIALGGAYLSALTLPHPRQERKRREALSLVLKSKGNTVPAANATTGILMPKDSEETLAEKRP